jgi:anaerobic selenocysteine-containing dehydrogenase
LGVSGRRRPYSNLGLVELDRTLIEGLDRLDPPTRILDQSRIGAVLTGDPRDLGNGAPIAALFIQNTNPLVVAPESRLVQHGFARADPFVCVHEQFMTATAAMADILPPATTSFLNTSLNNTPSSLAREGRPTALVHPAALARLGLGDDDRVRIGNRRGSLVLHAQGFAGHAKTGGHCRGAVAQSCFRGGYRDQSVDERRSRSAAGRRRLPRYLGLAEASVRRR